MGLPSRAEATVNGQKCREGGGWVVGDRTVGSVDEISRETRRETDRCSWPRGPKSHPTGVRASIVAEQRGNARGAKGRREVEA
jgi:hypothetical protein